MPTPHPESPLKNELALYIGGGCVFCHKVIHFLNDNNIDIPTVDVWRDETAFKEMTQLSGTTQVPCLKTGDGFMLESDDIIQQLKAWYL